MNIQDFIDRWEKKAAELSDNPADSDMIRLIQVSESSQITEMLEDLKEDMAQAEAEEAKKLGFNRFVGM